MKEHVFPITTFELNNETCYNRVKESDTHLQNKYVVLKLYTHTNARALLTDSRGKKEEDNMSFGGNQWFIIPRSNQALNEWVVEEIKGSDIYKNKDVLFDIKDLKDIMKYPLGLKNNSVIDSWKDELGDDKCFASVEYIEERILNSYEVAEFLRSYKDFMEVKNESK
jgi:hypothetical protein